MEMNHEINLKVAREVLTTNRLQGETYIMGLALRVLTRCVTVEDLTRLERVEPDIYKIITACPEAFSADDTKRILDVAQSRLPKDTDVHLPEGYREYHLRGVLSPMVEAEQEAAARRAAEGKSKA